MNQRHERRALTGDRNQCAGCGEFFNSTVAFEKHRTGEHANNGRRCLSPDEMSEKGMSKSSDDFWITKPFGNDAWSKSVIVQQPPDTGEDTLEWDQA